MSSNKKEETSVNKKAASKRARKAGRKKLGISGVIMAVIVAAVIIFNVVVIILDIEKYDDEKGLVSQKKEPQAVTEASVDEIKTEDPKTGETVTGDVATSEGSTGDAVTTESSTGVATTEEITTEKPIDPMENIRKEFPEMSEEDQRKVLYIHQNMRYYPMTLVTLLHKNHETLEFIYDYPTEHYKAVNNDISAEVAEAKKGQMPLFLQWDERWGYMEYGDGLMAYNGCGPTALSMVVTYLTKSDKYSPGVIAQYAADGNYYADGNGTAWSLIHTACEDFGIRSYGVGLDEGAMADALQSGNPIIACVGAGDFTDGGHFIVLTGYKDGQFSIKDPNSVKNTEVMWDYERLVGQIIGLWAFYRDEGLILED